MQVPDLRKMLFSEVSEVVLLNSYDIVQFCLPLLLLVIHLAVCLVTEIVVLIRPLVLVDVCRIEFVESRVIVTGIYCPLMYIRQRSGLLIVNRQVVYPSVRRLVI